MRQAHHEAGAGAEMIQIGEIIILDYKNDDYFSVTFRSDDSIWLSRKDGEGMKIKNIDLFNIINKYFTENH